MSQRQKNNLFEYDVMRYYLRTKHKYGLKLQPGQNIQNPFIAEKQKTPSFNIYESIPSHKWRYKDFKTGDEGDYIDLVKGLFNLSIPDALKRIKKDTQLIQGYNAPIETNMPKQPTAAKTTTVEQLPVYRPFTPQEGEFWKKYGIDLNTRKRYNVKAVKEYTAVSSEGKKYNIKCNAKNFIFAYDFGAWQKIYKPLGDKNKKFRYLGLKPKDYVFGFDQLPERGEVLYITGGEKDTLALAAHGFNAISLNSETATPDEKMMVGLKSRFKNVVVLYDNDRTGLEQSKRIADNYYIPRVILPAIANNGKDISDFIADGGTVDEFNKLTVAAIDDADISTAINGDFVTALALMNMSAEDSPKLWEPFFPQSGLGAIIGSSDSGKSAFCRQFALAAINREDTFLGHKLNVVNDCVYFISSEDDDIATSELLKMQSTGREIPHANFKNLFFLFDCEHLTDKLDRALSNNPASLVILDSFGDLFDGNDMNSNSKIRAYLKGFAELSRKHKCFFLFIHHVGKRTEVNGPSKHNAIGSQAFEAKMRVVMDLSTDEEGRKLMSVVKGNYLSREMKKSSYVLEFDEETLTFIYKDEQIAFNILKTEGGRKKQKINWVDIFGSDNVLKLATLEKRMLEKLDMPRGTSRNYIYEELENCGHGLYQIPKAKL